MNEQSSDEEWEEIMGKDVMFLRLSKGDKKGDSASMNTIVSADIKGYLSPKNCESVPFEILLNQSYKIGEGDAIPALELALRHSYVGEHLRVRCTAKFAYGGSGRVAIKSGCFQSATIPPNTDLEYEIEVLSHIQENQINPALLLDNKNDILHISSSSDDDESDRTNRQLQRLLALTELQQRKEAGNRWFAYQDYARSARAYSKATKIADTFFNGSTAEKNQAIVKGVKQSYEAEEEATTEGSSTNSSSKVTTTEAANHKANARLAAIAEAEAKKRQFDPADEVLLEIYVSCLNNMSACQLKLGDYTKTKDICIRVLEIQPMNLKALLRAAKAALSTHCFEECEACLSQLLLLAPPGSSAAVAGKVERQALKQAREKYKKQCRNMSANMANKLFPTTTANNNTNNNDRFTTNTSNKVTKKVNKATDTTTSSDDSTTDNISTCSISTNRTSANSNISTNDYNISSNVCDIMRNMETNDYNVAIPNTYTDKTTPTTSKTTPTTVVIGGEKGKTTTKVATSLLPSSSSTVTSQTVATDSSLLLLLGTSLLVLAISVVIVIWANYHHTNTTTSNE